MSNNYKYEPPLPVNNDGTPNLRYNDEMTKWVYEAIKKGITYVESCRGYQIGKEIEPILKEDTVDKNPISKNQPYNQNQLGMSSLNIAKDVRLNREIKTSLANIKPFAHYTTPSKDAAINEILTEINKIHRGWWYNTGYLNTSGFRAFDLACDYASCASGFIYLLPKKCPTTGDIKIVPEVLSWKDIAVLGLPPDMNLQRAYFVATRFETPYHEAVAQFPQLRNVTPTRDAPSWVSRAYHWMKEKLHKSPALNAVSSARTESPESMSKPFPYFDIFRCFIDDGRINMTGVSAIIDGGEKGKVIVPSYYTKNPETGEKEITKVLVREEQVATNNVDVSDPNNLKPIMETRKVYRDITPDECRYYPNRRFVIFALTGEGVLLLDRQNDLWTKNIPIAHILFHDIPQEFLGIAPIKIALSPIAEGNRLIRSSSDSVVAKLFNLFGINSQLPKEVKQVLKEKLLLRAATQKTIEYNMNLYKDKPVMPLIDPEMYTVDAESSKLIDLCFSQAEYLTSTPDATAMMRNLQTPSDDTQEALFKKLGMVFTDFSRNLEGGVQTIGDVWLPMFLQFTTTQQLLHILGSESMPQLYDFNPNNILPLTTPDGRSRSDRAKELLHRIHYLVVQDSLHEQNSYTHKLELLQQQKPGVPISGRRIYKAFNPEATDYDMMWKEWEDEKERQVYFTTRIQQNAIKIANLAGQVTASDILAGLDESSHVTGRKPSYNQQPSLEEKKDDNGVPRTTITNS